MKYNSDYIYSKSCKERLESQICSACERRFYAKLGLARRKLGIQRLGGKPNTANEFAQAI